MPSGGFSSALTGGAYLEIQSGVHEWTTKVELREAFELFGEVLHVHLPSIYSDEKPYVKFKWADGAHAAQEACIEGRVTLDGERLRTVFKDRILSSRDYDSRPEHRKEADYNLSRDAFSELVKSLGVAKKRKKRSDSDTSGSSGSRKAKKKKAGKNIKRNEALLALTEGDEPLLQLEDTINNAESFALLRSVESGNLKRCLALLKTNPLVDQLKKDGTTALHAAAKRGSAEICAALLLARADANTVAKDGCAPLHCAAASGSHDACVALLAAKALVNAQVPHGGNRPGATALHIAAEKNFTAICLTLRKAGASGAILNAEGRSPLDIIQKRQAAEEEKQERRRLMRERRKNTPTTIESEEEKEASKGIDKNVTVELDDDAKDEEENRRRLQRERRLKNMKTLEELEQEQARERDAAEKRKQRRLEARKAVAAEGTAILEIGED